jgi:hypothetical protein
MAEDYERRFRTLAVDVFDPAGLRRAKMRRAEMPPATAATRAINLARMTPRAKSLGQTDGTGGGVSFCVPGVWWRYPTQRRQPRGAGSREVRGSQAEEAQHGFFRVKSDLHASRRAARSSTRLAGPDRRRCSPQSSHRSPYSISSGAVAPPLVAGGFDGFGDVPPPSSRTASVVGRGFAGGFGGGDGVRPPSSPTA